MIASIHSLTRSLVVTFIMEVLLTVVEIPGTARAKSPQLFTHVVIVHHGEPALAGFDARGTGITTTKNRDKPYDGANDET
jgi:hypothetical protein